MTEAEPTHGDRIRVLFSDAYGEIAIIAPFIKVEALISLIDVVPLNTRIRCVTRWLPRDVAAGVSDPEILDVLEERGRFTLTLVDNLHAKLYIAGDDCLVGSSNVTFQGLGEIRNGNIEVLVATTIQDPAVALTLDNIAKSERPATRALADATRRLAESLSQSAAKFDSGKQWFPHSRRPEHAFRFYSDPPTGYLVEADQILLSDVVGLNIPLGLDEIAFRCEVRERMGTFPILDVFLDATGDVTLTYAEARSYLKLFATGDFSTNDLWLAFTKWMLHFFPYQIINQPITEVALRRAQVLDD